MGTLGLIGSRGGEKRWVSWGAHAVGVDEEDGVPGTDFAEAAAGFGMDAEEPVAVEVEEVVIAAAPGPVAGVEEGLLVDVGGAAVFGDHLQEAVAAVGVHQRIDDDDEVVEQAGDRGIVGGEEVVDDREGGIGASSSSPWMV